MRTHRGMTLIELLVAVAIVALTVGLTMNALLGFRQLVEDVNHKRRAATAARQALLAIERDLRLAGYGIEPALAFDFTVYRGDGTSCGAQPGGAVGSNPCPALRDRVDGPDELVLYRRNPEYWGGDLGGAPVGKAWPLTAATATTLTLTTRGGEYFGKGQLLQLVCTGGASNAYVRLARTVTSATPESATLETVAAVAGDPFSQDPAVFFAGCGGIARAFLVDRLRYFVDPAVVMADGSTAPFLMLDRGVDRDGDGDIDAQDLVPVAPGIVDLQVAYVRPEPALVEVGSTAGTAIAWCNLAARPLQSAPGSCAGGLRVVQFTAGGGAADYEQFSYITASSAVRTSPDAGNITAVHVALVGRSPGRTERRESQPLLLNRAGAAAPPAAQPFVFSTAESVVSTPNLAARGLSFL